MRKIDTSIAGKRAGSAWLQMASLGWSVVVNNIFGIVYLWISRWPSAILFSLMAVWLSMCGGTLAQPTVSTSVRDRRIQLRCPPSIRALLAELAEMVNPDF